MAQGKPPAQHQVPALGQQAEREVLRSDALVEQQVQEQEERIQGLEGYTRQVHLADEEEPAQYTKAVQTQDVNRMKITLEYTMRSISDRYQVNPDELHNRIL